MQHLPLSERWFYRSDSGWRRFLAELCKPVVVGLSRRRQRGGEAMPVPVVGIGSIVVGGSGKTPAARWCFEQLAAAGEKVAIAVNGYGRSNREVVVLDAVERSWRDIGDEAWMLHWQLQQSQYREQSLIGVGFDRVAVVRQLIERGARVVVVDDALQQQEVALHLSLALVPPGVEKMALLPVGPLREPCEALQRADMLWWHDGSGRKLHGSGEVCSWYRLERVVNVGTGEELSRGGEVALLSGVGRNQQVCSLIEGAGWKVVWHFAVRDHGEFPRAVLREALGQGVPLLTTAKDLGRLVEAFSPKLLEQLWVVEVGMEFGRGEGRLREALWGLLG